MEETTLNIRISAGLAKAAGVLGREYALYRPTSALNPTSGISLSTLYCAFDARPNFRLITTAQPNRNYVALLADPSIVKQGDYLVGDDIYFIARVESLKPALCVMCNQVIDIFATSEMTTAGSNTYGGRTTASDVSVATGWPACVTARARGEADVTKLPSDVRAAYYDVLVAVIPGLQINFDMRIQDATAQYYEIISAELSQYGWKLLVGLITT